MIGDEALPVSLAGEGDEAAACAGPTAGMDEPEFEAFYLRTAGPLRSYLLHMCGNGALADDLLQEAYCRFLGARDLRPHEGERRAFLWKIAANLFYDHVRRPHRKHQDLPESLPVPDAGRAAILRTDMGRVLDVMPDRERTLLWLAYVEGASHREIAGVLGLNEKSIRVMLFRARGKLAALIREKGLVSEVIP